MPEFHYTEIEINWFPQSYYIMCWTNDFHCLMLNFTNNFSLRIIPFSLNYETVICIILKLNYYIFLSLIADWGATVSSNFICLCFLFIIFLGTNNSLCKIYQEEGPILQRDVAFPRGTFVSPHPIRPAKPILFYRFFLLSNFTGEQWFLLCLRSCDGKFLTM